MLGLTTCHISWPDRVCNSVSQEIDDSVDRIVAGMEGTPMTDGKSKSLVAYHEVNQPSTSSFTAYQSPEAHIYVMIVTSHHILHIIPPALLSKHVLYITRMNHNQVSNN